MSQDQALPPRRSVPAYPSCQNPAHKGSLHSQVAQSEEGAHSYRENLTQAGSPSTGKRNPSLPANSCRRARAKALPTTCAPITMIWARYLAMATTQVRGSDFLAPRPRLKGGPKIGFLRGERFNKIMAPMHTSCFIPLRTKGS